MKLKADIELDDIGIAKELIAENLITEEANKLIQAITSTMDEMRINASGGLKQSVTSIPMPDGFDIEMDEYWKFVNEGVEGTKGGKSYANYRYKNKRPPISAIYKYIANKGLTQKYLYAIRENIFQQGIKPRLFVDKAIEKYYRMK